MKTEHIQKRRLTLLTLLFLMAAMGCCSCGKSKRETPISLPASEQIDKHCKETIGQARVERISSHVWAAIGYDLASTVLIHTEGGNIVIDPGMSPERARDIRKALQAVVPEAPIKTIVYTHSHIDHIGGAAVFAEEDTDIWATEAFAGHLFKQYNLFSPIEVIRGRRQFGDNVALEDLPCNGIGRRTDIRAALKSGVLLPNRTFSKTATLEIGGLTLELVEAPGETHDQLFVWVEEDKTLIAGDNFYWTFPNLYTIRGTSPRPVSAWIKTIDAMRRKNAEHLIPGHTKPIHGRQKIAAALTNYRDSIQWVRDAVVRGANQGKDVDTLAEEIALPEHLSKHRYNKEFYGQIDWSVRAIYGNNLGWFDGRPDKLYPPGSREVAQREVTLMGGAGAVMKLADEALAKGEHRWAVHLLAKVQRSGLAGGTELDERLVRSYRALAGTLHNLNGRGYLLESARELEQGMPEYPAPQYSEEMVKQIPLKMIFDLMEVRLDPQGAMDVHETVEFIFPDEKRRFFVTVRRGIAEATEDSPLPGTPAPIASLTVDAKIYRKIAVKMTSPASALASGELKVEGSWLGFLKFMNRFEM